MQFILDTKGQGLVEYAMIMLLVALLVIVILAFSDQQSEICIVRWYPKYNRKPETPGNIYSRSTIFLSLFTGNR